MNKICLIMPIYPPHFEYANAFIRSFFEFKFDTQADLAFVFTNESEAQEFKSTNFTGYYKSLILPEFLCVSRDDGIINIKKFYALKKIYKNYEYLIIIDSESEFIKNVNLMQICDEFYANKRLFGNTTIANGDTIKAESKKFFSTKKEIKNDDLYFWFNQPCIYKGGFIEEFFRAANFINLTDFLRLNFCSFDFYVYGYFLLLYKDFKIEDVEVKAVWGFLEGVDFTPKSKKFTNFEFYQCHSDLKERLNDKKLFLIIQKNLQKQGLQDLQDLLEKIFIYHFGALIERYGGKFFSSIRLLLMLRSVKRIYRIQKQALNKSLANGTNLHQSTTKFLQDYIKSSKLDSLLAYKLGFAFMSVINNHLAVDMGGGGGEALSLRHKQRFKIPKFLRICKFIFCDVRVIFKENQNRGENEKI